MINGDHRTPGGRGNYLSCGISWPLSAAHGASEPSPKLSGLGVFINEPFQELATHLPASLGGSPTLPGQSDPASGSPLLLRGLQANLDFLAWSARGGAWETRSGAPACIPPAVPGGLKASRTFAGGSFQPQPCPILSPAFF